MPEIVDGGVRLTNDEWNRLVKPLDIPDHTVNDVFNVLAGRIDASYNVAHVVRELIDAGESGSSVPPDDLPAAIHRIGEARHRAEHTAKQLAGEIADLTDVLHDRLPTVFATVWDEATGGEEENEAGVSPMFDAGLNAFRLALRLVTDYDMRDRDQARPTEPGHYAKRSVTFGDGDGGATITFDRMPDVRNQPTGEKCTVCDGAGFMHRLGCPNADRPVTLTLWTRPVNRDHPAVDYLAEHLGALKGCNGLPACRLQLIANTLTDAADDLLPAHPTTSSGDPLDTWTMRCAERLADITADTYGLQSLADLLRSAWEHARLTILERRIPDPGTT